jgi:transcriptional regulator with XRE-family HTH domain
MTADKLKQARKDAGWTQVFLAGKMGVTQAYLSLMENGKRSVSERVARKAVRLLALPATELPFSLSQEMDQALTDARVGLELARLGYPGFAYLGKPRATRNPTALLLAALSMENLETRLAEALPWLLLKFEGFDVKALVDRARLRNLQNRLGFAVALAQEVAERNPLYAHRTAELQRLTQSLDPSRLLREDTFGGRETNNRLLAWVRDNRSEAAKHWNVLTDLKTEHLPYANQDP